MPEFTHQFRAMGTEVGLWLWHSDELIAQRALRQTEQYFAQIEAHLSRFKADSELSHLNYSAGKPFTASPLLFELVETALAWRKRTGGIFDPTVLKALLAHGYDRSFEEIVNRTDQNVSINRTTSLARPQVKLNRAHHTITLPQGVGLDLGGIAKGWTVQQAGQKLGQLGPALVDAGGDIACMGAPPTSSAWLVGIDNPLQPNTDLATLTLNNEVVATSSLARRRWQHQGQMVHHLIDPRTGAPAITDLLSVTVIGPHLPEAEIQAKVALILGAQKGLAYLATQPDVSALLVTTDGRQLNCGTFKEKAYVYSHNFTNTFITLV